MDIITQKTNEKQDVLENIFRDIPIVLAADGLHLYYLIKNPSEELEKFILTGNKDRNEFQALSKKDMQEIVRCCKELGLTITYHKQNMEYMRKKIEIIYPRVNNTETVMKVSLIPWFMFPGRPYPVFAYVYGIWHYYSNGKKSLRLSADAAGKMFGIESLNKSTISRSIKAMEDIFAIFQIDRPLSTEEREVSSIEDIIGDISKILKECPSFETLKKIYGDKAALLPERVNNTENIPIALSGIPHECSKVIKDSDHTRIHPRDKRKRPARPRKKEIQSVQRSLCYVESQEIEQKRKDFIAYCRSMIMDAAITYHHFLL